MALALALALAATLGVGRFLGYAGALLLVGVVLFCAIAWPAQWKTSRVSILVRVGLGAATLAAVRTWSAGFAALGQPASPPTPTADNSSATGPCTCRSERNPSTSTKISGSRGNF